MDICFPVTRDQMFESETRGLHSFKLGGRDINT